MIKIEIETHNKNEVIDVTDLINEHLPHRDGHVYVILHNQSGGLTTIELEPGTEAELLTLNDILIHKISYTHNHDISKLTPEILSKLIGTSLDLSVLNGKLLLGTHQKVVLVELEGSKKREVELVFFTR